MRKGVGCAADKEAALPALPGTGICLAAGSDRDTVSHPLDIHLLRLGVLLNPNKLHVMPFIERFTPGLLGLGCNPYTPQYQQH